MAESPTAAYNRAKNAFLKGDLDRAATEAAKSGERWKNDKNSLWFWKFRLLEAEALTAESKGKEAVQLINEPLPARHELSQLEVRRLIDWAALLRNKDEVAKVLEQARKNVTDPELEIRISLSEGANRLSESGAGLESFRAALNKAENERSLYWQAMALNNLSISAKALYHYEDSVNYGLRALAAAEKANARRVAALAHGNLGSTYALLGDFDRAFDHQEKAIRIFEQIGARSNFTIGVGELGLLYDLQGQTRKAIVNFEKAYKMAIELGRTVDGERNASNLALGLTREGRWEEAAEWNERASKLAPAAEAPHIGRNRALIAFAQGKADDAARICKELLGGSATPFGLRWELHALLGKIAFEAKRTSLGNREYEAARKDLDATRSDLANPYNRIIFFSRLIGFYQDYVDALVSQGDDAGALRVAELSRARVLIEKIGGQLHSEESPSLVALKNLARSTHSSLLTFWVAPKRSFAWLATSSGVQRFDLPSAREIDSLVTRYRNVVEHSVSDPISSHDSSVGELWTKLLAPMASRIPKDGRLIVIPDGPLYRVNLETIVVPSPAPHYWIEDVELAIAPSLTLAASHPDPVGQHAPSLLLIGAPEYAGTEYAPLPNAATEMQRIGAHFPGMNQQVFTGAQASPGAYARAQAADFSLIHFAAHAEANAERPLESAIVLSRDGGNNKLYAREVLDTHLNAGLVTISSCRSAGARTYAGEGLIGFAWAFLLAGARDVVAGLWDVNDASTAALMDRFYGGISSGEDPVTALRKAKLALLKGDPRYRKAFYWAPFETYVGSAARQWSLPAVDPRMAKTF